jgi:phage gp36-like protein
MSYVQFSQLTAEIPLKFLTDALDDDADGVIDAGLWDTVSAAVDLEINGTLGKRYTVPFPDPAPAFVSQAAFILACFKVYGRRVSEEQNPFSDQAKMVRTQLAAIGKGEEPSASLISEHSKTFSHRRLTI